MGDRDAVTDDKVNPKHYADLGEYSAVHIIRAWNKFRRAIGAREIGFNVGNAIKYLQRAGLKGGESEEVDVDKAVWYLRNHLHDLNPEKYPDPAAK